MNIFNGLRIFPGSDFHAHPANEVAEGRRSPSQLIRYYQRREDRFDGPNRTQTDRKEDRKKLNTVKSNI